MEFKDKNCCTGCGACVAICPQGAISLIEDEEGFMYPHIEKEKCIHCHLCDLVCPWNDEENNIKRIDKFPLFYAAQLKDKKELPEVSSGGAAWALAKYIITSHGIVYAAVQEDINHVVHRRIDSINELLKTRKSKYLQSDISGCYGSIKKDLEADRIVLFIGTGCQVAAVKSFLRKDYSNFITGDVVCHGVPSTLIWNDYISEVEKRNELKIENIIYRDKSHGWQNNQYKISFSDGSCIKESSAYNPFHRGYLLGLYSRPSCGSCKFNLLPRMADFTFADYWKYDGEKFISTVSLGISLISINSMAAQRYLVKLCNLLDVEKTSEKRALESCRQMDHAPAQSKKRRQFWKIYKKRGFYKAWDRYIKPQKELRVITILRKEYRTVHNEIEDFIKRVFRIL